MRATLLLAALLATAWTESACAPLVVAGGATAVAVAHDRRTTGAQVDDELIEVKSGAAIARDHELNERTHVNVTSLNGVVLLTGEAPTAEMRDRALAAVRDVAGVRRTVNEVRVAEPSAFRDRSDDTWVTSKVKARLVGVKGLDSTQVKVVTEHRVVYLMGLLYRKEADLATEATRDVAGVARVVKLFEYLD